MSLNTILATAPLTTTNYILKATGTTIGNSLIWDNGTNVGIGNTNTSYTLDVTGTINATKTLTLRGQTDPASGVGMELFYRTADTASYIQSYDRTNSAWKDVKIYGNALYFGTQGNNTLTIASSGNVGIGTSSPANKLQVTGTAGNIVTDIDNGCIFNLNGGAITTANNGVSIQFSRTGDQLAYIGAARENTTDSSGFLSFATQKSDGTHPERMRITSGGFTKISNSGSYLDAASTYHELRNSTNDNWAVILSNSSSPSPYGLLIKYSGASPNNASNNFLTCSDSTQDKLNIYSNGNVVNRNNSYGLLSDIKLKENIVDSTPKLEDLLKVRIVNYNLIADPDLKQIGVIAQELEQIFPSLVDEHIDKDDEHNDLGTTTKSVKMSVFVPILIKAIQELSAKNEELSNRLIKLESK